ncbi:MAG: FAD-dependent oxidoreductase [Anaerolineae bacterium]
MAKPIILTVDDDPAVLSAIERDLRQHYASQYRIVKAASGADALDVVTQVQRRGETIALFLADQRMPVMEGTRFLGEAIRSFPDARKVLLTAYADTQAAIQSINEIGLDYYLLKPWDPPEQYLYPVLDDLLTEWSRTATAPYSGIRVAGTLWSPQSHQVKDFLSRNRISYRWLDIEKDETAATMVAQVDIARQALPVVFFPDGSILRNPTAREIAEKVGLNTQAALPLYDLAILGGGPAGLGAAVYAASEGLRTVLIEREATGGQAGTSSRIENYLGFPNGLSGAELAQRATIQAQRFGAEILTAQEAESVRADDTLRLVTLRDGTTLAAHAVLVATGASVQKLEAPGVERLTGAGIYYGAALSEAAHYRDEHVIVVGGANSAGQAAMFFSRYARKVTLLVRATSLEKGMSQYLVDQINATPAIEARLRTVVQAADGGNRLEEVTVEDVNTGEVVTLPAAAMFVFIGAVPHSEMVANLVQCNPGRFIYTGPDVRANGGHPANWPLTRDPMLLETSVPGVFAAGDVRHGAVRRVASAVGEGAVAVGLVHQYLKTV